MPDRMDEFLQERTKEAYERLTARERELQRYREIVEKQALELDAYRARLKEEQRGR